MDTDTSENMEVLNAGVLVIPSLSDVQIAALTPKTGMIVFDNVNSKLMFYAAAAWETAA